MTIFSPNTPPPADGQRAVHMPRCAMCCGWDGGDDDLGVCLFRDRETRRDAVACPDFALMLRTFGNVR
ncbi:hypothetical protein [Pinisolibacter sp.]|uniref:hypothetical protein n=1 Tax=Pinisolibacter sp. TaxID=2172024 RepID=UPI002FDE61C4